MNGILANAPLYAILSSALAAVAIVFTGEKHRNLRETWTVLASLAKFGFIAAMVPGVLAGERFEVALVELAPGISLALRADPAGLLFALSASFLWILTSFYSIGYMRGGKEDKQTRFFAMLAVCLSATMGIALAANLLTFVLFYEILSVATYPLVIHKGSEKAYRAGRQYLVYAITAGLVLVAGTALVYQMAGTLDFQGGGFLPADAGRGVLVTAFLLFFVGFGVKGGVMPLHSWLPAAMIAPTPVSALLHAVAVVKAGVFGFVRLVGFVFGPGLTGEIGLSGVLAGIAGITILLASFIAMTKDDLKARLAYSTVGHLSYVVLGVALLTPTGMLGGAYHIVTHAAMKITLFFCAGALYVHMRYTKVSELDGVGRRMPITMGAFAIGAIGLAGIPGTGGFLSKVLIAQGAAEGGEILFLVILLVSGLLNAGYLFPVFIRAFFRSSPKHTRYDEASWFMVGPIAVTAGLALLLGITPDALFRFFSVASDAMASVVAGGGP
jgi:multicomponent Na+:H+ antiporter subunit D